MSRPLGFSHKNVNFCASSKYPCMSTTLTSSIQTLLAFVFIFACLPLWSQTEQSKIVESLSFRSIGPAGMSGRVTTIDVNPRNEAHILAGTASGGLWESKDAGVTWSPIFDSMDVQSIGAVAFDPIRSGIIWVGTGEGNPRNSHNSGKGLYKSVDGGAHWTFLGLEETKLIHRIIINPLQPDQVFIGALGSAWGPNEERGVYRTQDGGQTFEKILYQNETTGCADLIIDPSNPNKLFAAMWDFERKPYTFRSGGEGSGLWVTYDGGDQWSQISSKQGLPKGELGRIGLTISADDPSIVYALIEAKTNGLYRSEDGGKKWSKVKSNNIGNRPFYYADIYADPNDANTLYNLYSVLSKSTDGGETFEVIAPYYGVHPDHHAFWINPHNSNHLINGNDGGMNISRDSGTSWRFVRNLPVGQFYHVRVDNQFPYRIYGGMQDNGSWVGPSNVLKRGGIRSDDWQEVLFGDGFDVLPQVGNPDYVYAMYQGGSVSRIHVPTGKTWPIQPVSEDSIPLRFNWDAAIAPDPFNERALYFGSQYVHYSTNYGQSWDRISPDLTTNDTTKQKQAESGGLTIDATQAENYTTVVVIEASSHREGEVWAGTDDGRLHYTLDRGANWVELSNRLPGLPEHAWITQIRISPIHPDEVFVVANDYRNNNWSAYAYMSSDAGRTWSRIVSDDDVSAHCWSIVQDHKDDRILFLGTDMGLYYSLNKGKDWSRWKSFPATPVRDMQIQEEEDDLVLGTFGRSFFILDDISPLRSIAEGVHKKAEFKILSATDGYQMEYKSYKGERFPADGIFTGQTESFAPKINLWIAPSEEQEETLDSLNADLENSEDSLSFPEDQKIKWIIFDANRDTIRRTEQKVETGLQRLRWSMRADGIRWPSRRTIKEDDLPPSGARVAPGDYLIKLIYGDYMDSVQVKVSYDPRLEYPRAEMQEIEKMRKAFEEKTIQPAFELMEKMKQSLSTIKRLESVFDNNEEALDSLKSWSKPIKKQIQSFKKDLLGPRDEKGIDSVTKYLTNLMGTAYSMINNAEGVENENAAAAIQQVDRAWQPFQEKVDAFYDSDWVEFKEKVQKLEVTLFED